MRPTDRLVLPLKYESIYLEPAGNQYRGEGVVSLAFREDLYYKVVHRQITRTLQRSSFALAE